MIATGESTLEMGSAELALLVVGAIFTLGLGGLFAFVFLRKDDPGSSSEGGASDDVD